MTLTDFSAPGGVRRRWGAQQAGGREETCIEYAVVTEGTAGDNRTICGGRYGVDKYHTI